MLLLELFWSFVKIGFTSFGGLSMIPLISGEMISHGWMTASEVSDIVAIAEMTPGPLGLNCATFAGMRAAG
ncbi:MAG: chromate transporter, partial [Synergistaceae bacterium]|nr:chromate transporter [Synergistaceae bacterium]